MFLALLTRGFSTWRFCWWLNVKWHSACKLLVKKKLILVCHLRSCTLMQRSPTRHTCVCTHARTLRLVQTSRATATCSPFPLSAVPVKLHSSARHLNNGWSAFYLSCTQLGTQRFILCTSTCYVFVFNRYFLCKCWKKWKCFWYFQRTMLDLTVALSFVVALYL